MRLTDNAFRVSVYENPKMFIKNNDAMLKIRFDLSFTMLFYVKINLFMTFSKRQLRRQ